jgi:hypothetical protein
MTLPLPQSVLDGITQLFDREFPRLQLHLDNLSTNPEDHLSLTTRLSETIPSLPVSFSNAVNGVLMEQASTDNAPTYTVVGAPHEVLPLYAEEEASPASLPASSA